MQAPINGIRMTYDVSGTESGPPVVLHHSLAMNLSLWNELAAALAPKYHVIRFDARGHGQTEATKAPYTFEMLSDDSSSSWIISRCRRRTSSGYRWAAWWGSTWGCSIRNASRA